MTNALLKNTLTAPLVIKKFMSNFKEQQQIREQQKALNELLVTECKNKNVSLDSVKALVASGADIHYKNSAALYWATRKHSFDVIRFLIAKGALESCDNARRHISKICDYKFSDKVEPKFFEILDLAHSRVGEFMTLFTPYINHMMVNGRLDKIKSLQARYGLTDKEIVDVIELRVIFEVIINSFVEELLFIETHKSWIDRRSFDSAVDSGELIVLEYMLSKNYFFIPSDSAIAKAVYDGCYDVLDRLIENGYSFERKPLFLEKACRAAFNLGGEPLAYLLKHGYTLDDIYKDKTIIEHAVIDKNANLIAFLNQNKGYYSAGQAPPPPAEGRPFAF